MGLLPVVMFMLFLTGTKSSKYSIFIKDSICDLDEKIGNGCTREVSRSGILKCVAECSRQSSCIGASLEIRTGKCFIHKWCSIHQTMCNTLSSDHKYYSNFCVHGKWDLETRACQCDFGTYGDRCDKAHQSCHALIPSGYSQGRYVVYLDPKQDGDMRKVVCSVTESLTSILTIINQGEISFNRTWRDYLNGFHSDDMTNLWIGLRMWNVQSSQFGCKKAVFVLHFKDTSVAYRVYSNLVVGDENTNYSFTFKKSRPAKRGHMSEPYEAGDCLGDAQNISFSTWDKNNYEEADKNCPSDTGSGWWNLYNCNNPCNLLGWGLEDWSSAPTKQRFSMMGVDMVQAAEQIRNFFVYLDCDPL